MRRNRTRQPSEILAGLQAKARALEPKETMTDEETIAHMRKPRVHQLSNVKPKTVVITRAVPKAGGGWQTETLDLNGEWTPFAGNDHHVIGGVR